MATGHPPCSRPPQALTAASPAPAARSTPVSHPGPTASIHETAGAPDTGASPFPAPGGTCLPVMADPQYFDVRHCSVNIRPTILAIDLPAAGAQASAPLRG